MNSLWNYFDYLEKFSNIALNIHKNNINNIENVTWKLVERP
jgi:hypothetical protein